MDQHQVRPHKCSSRDTSPDRAKICRKVIKPARKVQVVYYLSRNGLLEHPHFMELTLLSNQPLRLKDVFDRLMVLRGSGMPLQYSWSSKRNYKSGYVWFDLALKDVIYPSEGGEYVLKGSELVEGCSERFQQLNVSNKSGIHEPPETNYGYNAKSKVLSSRQQQKESEEYEEYEEQEEEKEFTSSTTTPHSRCSRGVSTEELGEDEDRHEALQNNTKTEKVVVTTTNNRSSRGGNVSNVSSAKDHSTAAAASLAEKLNRRVVVPVQSKRFGSESGTESTTSAAAPSRYSALLQLIACGSSGAEFKARTQQEPRVSSVGTTASKQRQSVDRGGRDEKAFMMSCEEEEEEEAVAMMMNRVSENPRLMLGNLQNAEEKEYFSGSLVEMESMKANHPVLKRSNSYNEERRSKLGMEEVKLKKEMEEENRERKGGVKEKCIPIKKSSKESSRRW